MRKPERRGTDYNLSKRRELVSLYVLHLSHKMKSAIQFVKVQ